MEFGLRNEDLEYIKNKIKKFSEIEKAVIFGSRAKGNYQKASDIDIAIFGDVITLDTIAKLHSDLEELSPMPYMFDIVSFNDIDNYALKDHIIRVGKTIFERRPIFRWLFTKKIIK